jgi:PAS domain S-box-containing protein
MKRGAVVRLSRNSAVEDKRLQLLQSERQLLSKIAAGVPLTEVLDELLRAVEAGSQGRMLASILLLDQEGKHLLHGAAPGLPQAYNDAIHGGAIGPGMGSCGTAAFFGMPVFVSDIASDPLWSDYRDLALAHGLAACWSTPIKAADGRVLGTFAIYYREPRSPTLEDIDAIGLITHTAALAIERDLSERLLRESEARLQEALTAGRVMAFEWDPATRQSHRSANAALILGSESKEGGGGKVNTFLARVHPDDRARFKAHLFGVSRERPSFSVSFRYLRPDGREVWLEETASAEFDAAGRCVRLKGLTRDITEQKRAEERQNLLIAELDHRVKNALACVAVVAQHTRERSRCMDEFVERLTGRIQSMANTHALLSRGRWQGASVSDLARCVLAPCLAEGNAVVEGPEVVLSAEATQALAMAIHELVTNAAKYGALSTPEGRVSVRWDCRRGDRRRRLVLDWQETGGPPVVPPSHRGYGTSVIRDLIPYELGGAVDLSFAPEGVRCRLDIPL